MSAITNLIGRAYLEHAAWHCKHNMGPWRRVRDGWNEHLERRDCRHCDTHEVRTAL